MTRPSATERSAHVRVRDVYDADPILSEANRSSAALGIAIMLCLAVLLGVVVGWLVSRIA